MFPSHFVYLYFLSFNFNHPDINLSLIYRRAPQLRGQPHRAPNSRAVRHKPSGHRYALTSHGDAHELRGWHRLPPGDGPHLLERRVDRANLLPPAALARRLRVQHRDRRGPQSAVLETEVPRRRLRRQQDLRRRLEGQEGPRLRAGW